LFSLFEKNAGNVSPTHEDVYMVYRLGDKSKTGHRIKEKGRKCERAIFPFVYNMANPTTAATIPVKNLPVLRPRAPLTLPVALAGREEVEDPELLGGAEEEEEAGREELGEEAERELVSLISF